MADPAAPRDWIQPARLLILAVTLGAIVRLAAAAVPAIHYPDEIWQYMEPARHLAGDRWVVPWEFREGLRSWLIPAALAPFHMLGDWLAPTTQLPMFLQRAACVLLSLGVVAGAVAIGLRTSRMHGLFAGLVSASWFELVYMAPRPFAEAVCLGIALPAVALLALAPERRSRPVMMAAGALLGLAFCLRFHLAPALLVIAAFGCGVRLRNGWLPLAAGWTAAMAAAGAAEFAAGGTPFAWMLRNVAVNVLEGRSEHFGTAPVYEYAVYAARNYGLLVVPGALLALAGARLQPAMFAAAVVNLAAHSAIPHKEPRFVLLSVALLVILAALGTAEMLNALARRWPAALSRRAVTAASLGWIGISAACAMTQPFEREWHRGRELVLSLAAAAADPAACGLGLLRLGHNPTGAYTLYNRDTPIYLFLDEEAARRAKAAAQGYNLLVAMQGAEVPEGYVLRRCFAAGPNAHGALQPYCLYKRPGRCAPGAAAAESEINRVLREHGY